MKFIETQNILYTKQSGFRQKYSTTQALLSTTNKMQKAVDEGAYFCGIFLNCSKARFGHRKSQYFYYETRSLWLERDC